MPEKNTDFIQNHWEGIYGAKKLQEMTWFEARPKIFLQFLNELNLELNSPIIDIGGGDSLWVDNMIDLGYTDLSVLDISKKALDRAKNRLGEKGNGIHWIHQDVTSFETHKEFELWHDRATFHFLKEESKIEQYIEVAQSCLSSDGIMIISTFSPDGPSHCSGLEIRQYSEESLMVKLNKYFKRVKCLKNNHLTPLGLNQNFISCSFKKL